MASGGGIGLACLLWLLSACAGGAPAVFVAEGAPRASEIQRVLLVGMNFDETPQPALVRGVEKLEERVDGYLRSTGRHVVRVRLREVLPVWQEIAAQYDDFLEEDGETLNEEAVEEARAELARRLGDVYEVDAIAMPTLRLREGYHVGRSLRWDGVTRPVPIEMDTVLHEVHAIAGKGVGTSLRMTLYAPDGRRLFERHAGLEPVMYYRVGGIGTARGGQGQSYPRTDLFRDPEVLDEGVVLSLTPVIPPPVATAE